MRRPATTDVTLTFGYHADYPLHNGMHYGVDFAYVPDEQIYAPEAGTVIVRPLNGDDGNAVYMQLGNQFHGFCHLQSFNVSDGQQVASGQVLGIMGDTGNADGRHLHWAVKVAGSFVDPLTLVDEQGEDMQTSELEDLANKRQDWLTDIGKLLSVPGPIDGNNIAQILANIRTEQERIDQLTELVSNGDTDAAEQIEQIKEILSKGK